MEELRKKFGRSTNETLFTPECDVRFQTKLAIILPFREDQNDILYEDQLKWLLNYLIPLLQRLDLKFNHKPRNAQVQAFYSSPFIKTTEYKVKYFIQSVDQLVDPKIAITEIFPKT